MISIYSLVGGGGGGGGRGERLISVIGMGLSRVWGTRLGNGPAYLGVDQNPTRLGPTNSGCLSLPHRLENEAEFKSTFLQARSRPGLMAARSALPSASLKKSQGTPRKIKGRAPTGM